MTPRARVWTIVGVVAVATAAAAMGLTVLTRNDVSEETSAAPPFLADPTAPAEISQDVRQALLAWPAGTLRRLRILAARHPRNALVQLELGLSLAFLGQDGDARRAWQVAERVQPDSPSALRAEDLRHPRTPPGRPPFVPSFARARTAAQKRLLRGAAFQQALRPVSAEREFAAAVRAAPDDAEALTAAAVGLYDKDRPAQAFSQLGPLARRFPHEQTVRFHLGLLLIYFGDMSRAWHELRLARAEGPSTRLGKRAQQLLEAGQKR